MKPVPYNEISSTFLGACGLNPFHQHNSSSRTQMFASHLGQMLVVSGANERTIQSGMEREYGKYTFKVEMPVDGLILEVIQRYPGTLGSDAIAHNPQTMVIYEDNDTKEIGVINMTDYCSNHQYFGFRYVTKGGINQLRVGAQIAKGTVFLDSPNITNEGDYKYGIQAKVAYITHPAVSEDGIGMSSALLPKLGFKTYETRVVSWGKKNFALNLYGDESNYKAFPDIGDVIRSDGVLMALRSYEPDELAIVEQGVKSTLQIDYTFDTTVYANGPGGKIIDIRVHHDAVDTNCAEIHMDGQVQKYDRARRMYYQKIMTVWRKLERQRGDALQITPEFQQLIVQAQSVVSEGGKQRVAKLYRKAPLDIYRVEFVIEYDVVPSIGFKITDTHASKGVMCQTIPEEDMPMDSEGNRAELIMDPNSVINRANPGRLYEFYYGAASRDVYRRLCVKLGLGINIRQVTAYNAICKLPEEVVADAFDYLMGFYKIISPTMVDWWTQGLIKASKEEYLSEVVEKGFHRQDVGLYVPTDNQPSSPDIVAQLETVGGGIYRPLYGPITYRGNSGNLVTTKRNVRIGSMYMILLEKIGDDWSSVSSGKLQLHGVLSQITSSDKYAKPARNQAVRGAGEAEVRIFVSYVGPWFMAELMDRNNNPKTHKAMVEKMLQADTPSNIQSMVDRKMIPFGGSKPLALLKHICSCSGFSFVHHKYKSTTLKV